jgi:aspartate oxidase
MMTLEELDKLENDTINSLELVIINIIELNKLTKKFNKDIQKIKEYIINESEIVQNAEALEVVNNQLTTIDREIKKENSFYLAANSNFEKIEYFPSDSFKLLYKEEIGIRLEQKWANKPQNIDNIYF